MESSTLAPHEPHGSSAPTGRPCTAMYLGAFLFVSFTQSTRYIEYMKTPITERPFFYPAIIISLGILLAGLFAGYFVSKIRGANDSLSVTGSAVQHVVSDTAKLSGSVTRTVSEGGIPGGYAMIAADTAKIKKTALAAGLTEADITTLSATVYEQFNYGQNGQITERNFIVTQQIILSSNSTDKIKNFSDKAAEIASQGVRFQTGGPEYYYSKLPELRISLLGEAIKDAKARANSIAQSAGNSVGGLRSASVGIVQVLAPNSQNISDYGTYDTSTLEKDVMVTVRAEFGIN